ncbi:MAG: cadmium resistance transporter [Cyanobacteria bacterium Co-bin13]|nr:cadmium resistance transporter [Cyanobacteria bacterium Co-bin13]
MNWIVGTALTAVAVAFATTFDDNIYLTLFFGRTTRHFRPRHVVIGEFIGFTCLVTVSLVGFFGGLLISEQWIGLLGILPVLIGISNLINSDEEDGTVQTVSAGFLPLTRFHRPGSLFNTLRDPQTYRVSAVTIANGGNNLGIYIPLFASSTLPTLGITLVICYCAIGLWCLLSYNLTRQPAIAFVMTHYARRVFPFVLIWLGLSILFENGTHELLYALATH